MVLKAKVRRRPKKLGFCPSIKWCCGSSPSNWKIWVMSPIEDLNCLYPFTNTVTHLKLILYPNFLWRRGRFFRALSRMQSGKYKNVYAKGITSKIIRKIGKKSSLNWKARVTGGIQAPKIFWPFEHYVFWYLFRSKRRMSHPWSILLG